MRGRRLAEMDMGSRLTTVTVRLLPALALALLPHGDVQAKKCEDYPESHPTRQNSECRSQVPPYADAGRHLSEAERQIGEGDRAGAAATLGKILALQREYGLEVPASFWFVRAEVSLKAGDLAQAEQAAARYIQAAGREGEHYMGTLKLLDRIEAEQEKARLVAIARRWPPGTTFRDPLSSGSEGPSMVVLPAGNFRMGCLPDRDCYDYEKPVHEVRIARPFAVSVHEVTFEDYDRFIRVTDGREAYGRWGRGRRPVDVSWEDAKSYVAWLSSQTGEEYRLLSESEWEYAARAGTATKYSWGDETGRNRANCDGCGSQWDAEQTAPAGSFKPNGFGLYDMHGNVSEWVEDCAASSYRSAPADGSARLQGDCDFRMARGGSWLSHPRGLHSAARRALARDYPFYYVGFRIARTLAP